MSVITVLLLLVWWMMLCCRSLDTFLWPSSFSSPPPLPSPCQVPTLSFPRCTCPQPPRPIGSAKPSFKDFSQWLSMLIPRNWRITGNPPLPPLPQNHPQGHLHPHRVAVTLLLPFTYEPVWWKVVVVAECTHTLPLPLFRSWHPDVDTYFGSQNNSWTIYAIYLCPRSSILPLYGTLDMVSPCHGTFPLDCCMIWIDQHIHQILPYPGPSRSTPVGTL